MNGTRRTLSSQSGTPFEAELFEPPSPNAPAIIVIHEWWGINDDIRRIAGEFVDQGYAALAVDLYDGKSTADPVEAMGLANDLKTAVAMDKIAGAVDHLAATSPKIGITGFCLGGSMALAAALNVKGIAAAVPFYGTPRDEFARFSGAAPPILGHYAKTDPFVRAERVRELEARARAAGDSFEVHFYDAGHAFMRKGHPEHDPPAAELAWARTLAFFAAHLR